MIEKHCLLAFSVSFSYSSGQPAQEGTMHTWLGPSASNCSQENAPPPPAVEVISQLGSQSLVVLVDGQREPTMTLQLHHFFLHLVFSVFLCGFNIRVNPPWTKELPAILLLHLKNT